jgi:hypothetical protein
VTTVDDRPPPSAETTAAAREALEAWLAEADEYPMVDEVVRDETPGSQRWFLRVLGEAKGVWSLWVSVHQRSLHFETYFTPSPERNPAQFYEHLLVRNRSTGEVAFCIGEEHAVFLRARMPLEHVTADALDQMLGEFYVAVEDSFGTAVRLGFAKPGS